MAIFWIVIAVLLVAVELHHLAFYAMFGAAGALGAAGVALVAPGVVLLQIAVAIAVGALGVVVIRPYVSRAMEHRSQGARIAGVHGGLISARGMTVDEVGIHTPGHVRLLGENWLAVTIDGAPIPPQTPVIVTRVTGTTLTVRVAEHPWELT
jgi:membrane protein implicated in regulation of membrane protease activity